MPDYGLTHVALTCRDTSQSAAFYEKVAGLRVVHRRPSHNGLGEVIWLGDGHHAFVVVLIPVDGTIAPLSGPLNHLGVACTGRDDVDQRVAIARTLGAHVDGPHDSPPPVGYWAVVDDPNGHGVELSFGQDVETTATGAQMRDLTLRRTA